MADLVVLLGLADSSFGGKTLVETYEGRFPAEGEMAGRCDGAQWAVGSG